MKYCELTLTWEKGRRLKSASNGSESVTYTYDAFGMRRSKTVGGTETSYVYERGKLIREIRGSEKIDYLYGEEGIIGIKVGGEKYLYRKNVFGDVTEIYNEAGTLVGKYNYNAFGECEIELNEGGIAEKNAIRYRGYYYDEETGLYYLKTRYYDPEIGRFITIDDTSYLDPDGINGLNLYTYCGNNPVMRIDPTGEFFLTALLVGALIGGLISGSFSAVVAGIQGKDFRGVLGAFFGGFFTGAVIGLAMTTGGALAVGLIKATAVTVGVALGVTTAISFAGGIAAYAAVQWGNREKFNLKDAIVEGIITSVQSMLSFGIGAVLGGAGLWESLKPGKGLLDSIKIASEVVREFGKVGLRGVFHGGLTYIYNNFWQMIARTFYKQIFTAPWNLVKP